MIAEIDDVPDTGSAGLSPMGRVELRLGAIETLEAERTGASKLTSRLLALFGALGTAIALAFVTVTWDANADAATRDAAIAGLVEKARGQATTIHEIDARADTMERRIERADATQRAILNRLDRLSTQLDAILRRLPEARRRR